MQVTAASGEVVRGGAGPVAQPGQQDRGLEHGDRVGGAGQVAVAPGQPDDVHAPAAQLLLVEPVQDRRRGEEPGEPVGDRRRRGAATAARPCAPPLAPRPSGRPAGTGVTPDRLTAFAQVAAAMDTEPGASPNCASIAEWLDGISPYSQRVRGARGDLEVRRAGSGAELLDPAGGVERAADVEAVGRVDAGGGEVFAHPGPHVPLAVLVAVACGPPRPGAAAGTGCRSAP